MRHCTDSCAVAVEVTGCLWPGLAGCLCVMNNAGTVGPFWAPRDGLWDRRSLHLSLVFCDFTMPTLLVTAVGKMSTQILQAMLPQSLYFPCGSSVRDRCLAGRFSFMPLDQTKAYNLPEFKYSDTNILALPSLNSRIINISWKN